jgi:UDP:flavonoid glycosyltransferase YjiC (YdhE family)
VAREQAMWNGVPIVGLPGAADQPDNIVKVVGLGAGVSPSSIWDVREQPLYESVMRVLSEPAFRESARKISTRLRSHKRSPVQQGVGWPSLPLLPSFPLASA